MQSWVWLALALAGFALLQILLYRYLRQGNPSKDRPPGTPGARTDTGRDGSRSGGDGRVDQPDDRAVGHDEEVRCTHCGARNERDAVFTYCRRCGQQLQ